MTPDQAEPQAQQANTKHGDGASGIARPARSGHDFSRLPIHSKTPTGSPTRETADKGTHAGERVHSSGVISAKTSLRPHEGGPASWRREAAIYAQGKTPIRVGGQLTAWDAKPLGAPETGAHLRQIQRQFATEGMDRSMRGLAHTRGKEFADSAAEHAGFSRAARSPGGGAIGQQAAAAIHASSASGALPNDMSEKLAKSSGHDFAGVSIHNDAGAHRAANLLNARAFTVGRSIYFARNEYQPSTTEGKHLLAHEAAHTVQHGAHTPSPNAHFQVTGGADKTETEAQHFADFVVGARTNAAPPLTPSARTGMVHRAISFTHANDAFTTNQVAATETAAGFRLGSDPGPSFQWNTDVTIHGVAGDPFGNFQVGFLQVERVFGINVHWGSGVNETVRTVRPDTRLPRRDNAGPETDIFYSDSEPTVRPAFAANGDVRSPSFSDTPQTELFPWDNPKPPRVGNTGWFNYSDAFVTYLSARDTTAGTGARAFRDIACIYWNLSANGQFNGARPVGNRVTLTTHPVNRGNVIQGAAAEFPAMHGGTIANGHDVTTDT